MNNTETQIFEQTTYEVDRSTAAHETADIALRLCGVTMRFAQIERVPRYDNGERESDVEHSYMLALVAPELAIALELPLDTGKVSQYAIIHDLIELKTGDVATFSLTADEIAAKEAIEHQALAELLTELPPHTARLVAEYEAQADSESRFVRAVDKLLPVVVDILGDGLRVMREDYGVNGMAALEVSQALLHQRIADKFGEEFPDITLAHQLLCELFEVEMDGVL